MNICIERDLILNTIDILGGLVTYAAVRSRISPGHPVPADPRQQEVDGLLPGGGGEPQHHEDVSVLAL